MTQDPIASIAGKLTRTQRDWILSLYGVLSNAFYPGRAHQACAALLSEGLVAQTQDRTGNTMYRLAPLGLEVRAFLERQSHGQE